MKVERRFMPVEVRVEGDKPKIIGYAAVFDNWSEDLGGFREIIRPGAFSKTIGEADVRALWNHDPNYVLGRTKSGTLTLREDSKGLYMEIDPPATQWARDLLETITRGDVDQMSFAFRAIKDRWYSEEGENRRELLEVSLRDGDVSPVTYPAYKATSVSTRSLEDAGFDMSSLNAIVLKNDRGAELTEDEVQLLKRSIEFLQAQLPEEPGQTDHSIKARMAMRLQLAELDCQ